MTGSTPFRQALGYSVDSCSSFPSLKDLMHVLMRREIGRDVSNTASILFLNGSESHFFKKKYNHHRPKIAEQPWTSFVPTEVLGRARFLRMGGHLPFFLLTGTSILLENAASRAARDAFTKKKNGRGGRCP